MKNRILVCINRLSFFYSHRSRLFLNLQSRGFEVVVLTANDIQERRSEFEIINLNLERGFGFSDLPRLILKICAANDRKAFDHIHFVGLRLGVLGMLISHSRYFKNTELSVCFSGMGELFIRNRFKIFRFLIGWLLKISSKKVAYVVQNNDDAEFIRTQVLKASKPITQIRGMGVPSTDNTLFGSSRGLISKPFVISYCGRITIAKGFLDFVDVFERLSLRYEIKTVIAGKLDCHSEAEFKRLARVISQLRDNKNVVFSGWVSNTPRFLSGSDLLVFPSRREGLPQAVVEAFSVKVPVIGYSVPGVKDLLTGLSECLVPKMGDIDGLQERIERLIRDPELYTQISRAVYERWSECYTEERIWGQWEQFFRDKI